MSIQLSHIKPEITLENEQSEVETEVENFSKLLEGYGNDSFLKNISPKSWSDHDWLLPDQIDEQMNSFEDLNLSNKTPIADKLLEELEEPNFDENQEIVQPKGY
mgnify:CR=1 FL=1